MEKGFGEFFLWGIYRSPFFLSFFRESPTFKKMLGYEDHEIPNRADTWKMLIFAEDLPGVLKNFDEHVKNKRCAQGKWYFYCNG